MKEDNSLEVQIRDLLASIYDQGGLDEVRIAEKIFFREIGKIRRREGDRSGLEKISPEDVHRERYSEIKGNSQGMLRIFALMDKVAGSNVPVLIQGESGTGKELIARAIHQNSPRSEKAYVTENCAAIPETLLESELFGYKRGAFTGADRNKQGLFVVADGGSLFLDEIGDMSLNMQKKMLRVLQDGEIRPVGGNDLVHVDVRIISASNKNLRALVDAKLFREDLFYRLNTITLEAPPLREEKEDIPELVLFFVEKISKELGIDPPEVSQQGLEALLRYSWPGNIRELENEIRRFLALKGPGGKINLDDLSEDVKNC